MTPTTNTSHQPRKRFGQNFLKDQAAISNILSAIQAGPEDTIIEIGPGMGAITQHLIHATGQLTAIEIDHDLSGYLLEHFPSLNLIQKDALKVDFSQLITNQEPKKNTVKVVGNLPYNISTPLLFHLLNYPSLIDEMYFLLQKEVVDRLSAEPNNKAYGRLSVIVQYHCEVSPLFDIYPESFKPKPKVNSSFVSIKPRDKKLTVNNISLFEQIVSHAFQQRRKTLRNALRSLLPDNMPDLLSATLSRRAESLSVDEFADLSNQLYSLTNR